MMVKEYPASVLFREGASTKDGGFVLVGEETPGGRISPRPCFLGLNEKYRVNLVPDLSGWRVL